MLHHWTEKLDELRERLVCVPRWLVASDFDGTLSSLTDYHDRAVLYPDARSMLTSLRSLHPRVCLAFLSGRSISDLSKLLGHDLDGVIIGGNHGLELRGAGLDWTHPASIAARPKMEELTRMLQSEIGSIIGAEIEDKGPSITLHFRRVSTPDLPRLDDVIEKLVLPDCIRQHRGNKVIEFRPMVEWHKGYALRRIMKRLGVPPSAVIYLGDDVTDEDAFKSLSSTGITVHIGSATDLSAARMWASDPADAVRFLQEIIKTLTTVRGSDAITKSGRIA